jgi:hypothetical protein
MNDRVQWTRSDREQDQQAQDRAPRQTSSHAGPASTSTATSVAVSKPGPTPYICRGRRIDRIGTDNGYDPVRVRRTVSNRSGRRANTECGQQRQREDDRRDDNP